MIQVPRVAKFFLGPPSSPDLLKALGFKFLSERGTETKIEPLVGGRVVLQWISGDLLTFPRSANILAKC